LSPQPDEWYALLRSNAEGERYTTKLQAIRDGVELLWKEPRVVPNFTDHGIEHCDRVLGHLLEIYQQKRKNLQELNQQEIFALVAATYLHDIGMQCTIHPLLVKVGALVKDHYPAQYSLDEQAEVRRYHHILSAEMIQAANDLQDNDMMASYQAAIKTIPRDFITPIKDIAMYHSKLPLEQCQPNFLGNNRRLLLATLLRFADEMDISHDRVNFQDRMVYRKPLENEYWWWAHYHTALVELRDTRIIFHLRAKKADKGLMDDLKVCIVEEFKAKNEHVVDLLSQLGVTLSYATGPDWEFDDNLPEIPKEIRRLISQAASRSQQRALALSTDPDLVVECNKKYELSIIGQARSSFGNDQYEFAFAMVPHDAGTSATDVRISAGSHVFQMILGRPEDPMVGHAVQEFGSWLEWYGRRRGEFVGRIVGLSRGTAVSLAKCQSDLDGVGTCKVETVDLSGNEYQVVLRPTRSLAARHYSVNRQTGKVKLLKR
jgi:hypothetical protein